MRRSVLAAALLLALAAPAPALLDLPPEVDYRNTDYNGLLTFVRVRFNPSRWRPGNYMWGLDLKWNHDYPRAESHLMKILKETTLIEPNLGGGNILALDDPILFKYPVAYLCEPGFWTLSDAEAEGLRAYLGKGGFLIVDDFIGHHWYNFEEALAKALPDARLVELDPGHPIFNTFFSIDPQVFLHPNFGLVPAYFGVFEDNDPGKRLMMIANYNHDVGEFWEWSDTGYLPIDLSNEAYKLGVNYMIYALTR